MKQIICKIAFALAISIAVPRAAHADVQPLPQTSWPMYQYSPSHNAVFSKPKFRVTWVAQLGDRINGGLAVVRDTVYVDSFDHNLYALDLATGVIRWKAQADDILMSTPVVANGIVIVGSGHDGFLDSDDAAEIWGRAEGDDLIAFDARYGNRLWSLHTVGEDMASPAISGDRVVFANGDLHAYAVNLRDGRVLWKRDLPGVATMASATISGAFVYISLCHNSPHFQETRAIDIASGETAWRNPNGSCDASPVADGGSVFADGNEETVTPHDPGGVNTIAAIHAGTGRTRWTRSNGEGPYTLVASGEHSITGTAVDGVLYQSIVNRDLVVAYDERNGRELWRCRTIAPVKMSPVVASNRVIFGDTAGVLYSVDRKTGRVLHSGDFRDPFSTSPPVIVGETLIIANGHYVFAIPLNVI